MRFEHFALNVNEPVEMSKWYCSHLDLHLVVENGEPHFTRFLADASGQVVMELYKNPAASIEDHSQNHPLVFHIAFESDNAEAEKAKLMEAGASFVEEIKPEEGTHIVMLRDPWGLPLQICQRKNKLNKI